jgi:hypothetical protein
MSVTFSPPEKFSFQPKDWPTWIQRFSRFRRAVQLDTDDQDRQIDALLYSMGEESETIFENLQLTAQQQTYDTVVEKLTNHFIPKRNIIHERFTFHSAIQGTKSVEEFQRELYALSKHCEFKDRDDQIRDRFVLGLTDVDVKRKLHLEPDLTLEKAIKIAKQFEQVHSQMATTSSADEVRRPRWKRDEASGKASRKDERDQGNGRLQCSRCGYDHSKSQRCPADGKTCNKCQGKGHFSRMCKKMKADEVAGEGTDDESEDFEMEAIELDGIEFQDTERAWYETLTCCGSKISFKIDTGADITVISEKTYSALKTKPRLSPANLKLRSASGKLTVKGQFKAPVMWRGKEYIIKVVVVTEPLRNNLLSRSVSRGLGLVARIEDVSDSEKTAKIGLIKTEPVRIVLRDDAKPYSVHTARNPLPQNPTPEDLKQEEEVSAYVDAVINYLPVKTSRLDKIKSAMAQDLAMQNVLDYIRNGWPSSNKTPADIKCYRELRSQLSETDGLAIYQNRIVIPKAQRDEVLQKLHETHQGFTKCMANAERCVWWPGIRSQLKELTENCHHCVALRPAQRSEPLKVTPEGKKGDHVLVRKEGKWCKKPGTIVDGDKENRTYLSTTQGRTECRNRKDIMIYLTGPAPTEEDHEGNNAAPRVHQLPNMPEEGNDLPGEQPAHPVEPEEPAPHISPRITRSQTGAEIRRPIRYPDPDY